MSKTHDKKLIPIFFATDDNYIPFLDVAIRSLIENASKDYNYVINILNTGLKQENINLILKQENDNFVINFCDITEDFKPIKDKLRNVYHFGLAAYYRLFIDELFPQYDKCIYLDCDIVVLGDISKLYNTDLKDNYLAAVNDRIVLGLKEFSDYVRIVVGVEPQNYFSSGVLVINLEKFKERKICKQFMYLINKYNFDTVAPDQDYLNVLCKDKVKYLENGWNKQTIPAPLEGNLNIVHYALFKKPWEVDGVINEEYFWHYAKQSPFYEEILNRKNSYTPEMARKKEEANKEILLHALRIIDSDSTFNKEITKIRNALNYTFNFKK